MVFGLTILKTYRGRHSHHFIPSKQFDIVSLVLRDGVFVIVQLLLWFENDASYFPFTGAVYYA
jgi:hypothetical protein